MNCKRCNKKIVSEWRKDARTIKVNPLVYCSRECNNSRGKRSEETKIKIANSLRGKRKGPGDKGYRPVTYTQTQCPVCGNSFMYRAGYIQKTCSKVCRYHLYSINRQNYLQTNGSFSTPREIFRYKDLVIEVDSNLEKAGIIYLIDILNAKNVERYKNLLNYWEGDAHRTYNPDFICKIDNKTCIVEVKQKWSNNSKHTYNRTIPLKRQALELFCKDKGYTMLWIDFESTPKLKQIYKEILLTR